MSGQLVIAELDAFRTVLAKARPGEGEKVRAWCRSTITNALHRTGPTGAMNAAAETAWAAADRLAQGLDAEDASDCEIAERRAQALAHLAALVVAVRLVKAANVGEL